MTTNNNRYFAIIFPSALLAAALVLILFMFSGCNTERKDFDNKPYMSRADSLIKEESRLLDSARIVFTDLKSLAENGRNEAATKRREDFLLYLEEHSSNLDHAYKQNDRLWDSAFIAYWH